MNDAIHNSTVYKYIDMKKLQFKIFAYFYDNHSNNDNDNDDGDKNNNNDDGNNNSKNNIIIVVNTIDFLARYYWSRKTMVKIQQPEIIALFSCTFLSLKKS